MYVNTLKDYQIRKAHNDESTLIINMLKEIAQWLKKNEINQWQYLLEGGDDEEIIQAVTNKNTYIVLRNKEIIATFTLSSIQSEWDRHIFGEEADANSLYLHRFAIVPKYMGKGIGKDILIWIQEYMKNNKEYLNLDCVTSNIKLNNFYKRNGFEQIGVTDGHSKFQKRMKK
ncbi:GNAT family N-acetyltransferase [Bacillus bingmayongensis]|uniref:GNAT family N-acetyltransferase n=1 Tax=Bacillus bingmayongensis TaxID=1150157 RepID=UPI000317B341|nr:GNAT family N-acetyltransferase [Bacillus bingmayongensis]MBY0597496.1 GNAT family N-acetyltransferase [Bacillus bingmayongensis]